jgi:hypothetical protein
VEASLDISLRDRGGSASTPLGPLLVERSGDGDAFSGPAKGPFQPKRGEPRRLPEYNAE